MHLSDFKQGLVWVQGQDYHKYNHDDYLDHTKRDHTKRDQHLVPDPRPVLGMQRRDVGYAQRNGNR
jgi:hypothetical protein